ncbi:MAG: HD domain-containing protein [Burkholderiales bacterium]|nr:HD domain-containing protein [Burkholderiales bacterium]MDE2454239.1 HD domain-containing protein [Burkholderiales bacterium]
MSISPPGPVLPPVYTGRSSFLRTNRFLAASILCAAGRCEIHSSEDIYDSNGLMLWARRQPVAPALMARLADRELLRPIELCVTALDPVSTLAMMASLDALGARAPDFGLLLAPHREALLALLGDLAFDPQELLLLSVLRFGERDRLTHSIAVAAVAVVAGQWLGLGEAEQRRLLRAGLLHDVGLLYLPDESAGSEAEFARQRHPALGALCIRELTGCEPRIAELVANSHERPNGRGFPRGLREPALDPAAQALGFAEAVSDHLSRIGMGAQRAAVCSRVVPGEFAPALVSGVIALARDPSIGPQRQAPVRGPADVGRALRQLHAVLSRVLVLLSMPFDENDTVREAAALWLAEVDPLVRALRYAGVEDALAQGQEILPADALEHGELATLDEEIEHRMQCLRDAIEFRRSRDPQTADSRLVDGTLRLLESAASASAGAARI